MRVNVRPRGSCDRIIALCHGETPLSLLPTDASLRSRCFLINAQPPIDDYSLEIEYAWLVMITVSKWMKLLVVPDGSMGFGVRLIS